MCTAQLSRADCYHVTVQEDLGELKKKAGAADAANEKKKP